MSILDRLNLLIRSNINDSIGRQGQPSMRRALSEMESSLRDARRQQAELRRGEKQLIEQIRQARERVDQWEDRAMLALRNGDEDLAREALVVKNQAMHEVQRLRDRLDEHRAYLQDIERALEALEVKLEGTRSRMRAISSSNRPLPSATTRPATGDRDMSKWDAELERRKRERTGEAPLDERDYRRRDEFDEPGTFDTSSSFREMDRMASKIDSMEAEIDAMRELSGGADPRREKLERIFNDMEDSRRPRPQQPPLEDDDLADLKKKFE